jgi:hypothetical protein
VVLLDIELGRERHAGVALINAINKRHAGVPVLVVSAMPAAIYRSIMKALDAWDYLQKTTFEEADFIETFLEILRVARERKAQRQPPVAAGRRTRARPALAAHADLARRAHQPAADRAAHPGHAVPAARRSGLLRRSLRSREERAQPRQRAQARQHHPRCLPRGRPELRRHRKRAHARLPLGGGDVARAKAPAVKDFRGWIWQSPRCNQQAAPDDDDTCARSAFFSLRLPVGVLQDALFEKRRPVWPPEDLDRIDVSVAVLPPGDGAALLDSQAGPSTPPFSLADLKPLLLPGESLQIKRIADGLAPSTTLPFLIAPVDPEDLSWHFVTTLIRHLPVDAYDVPLEAKEVITHAGRKL